MGMISDNTQLHKFGLQVQQLLGSEPFGFVNINNLKWEMKQSFDYSVDEKAEEFGYASFEDMLDSKVLADYVEIERERIGEGGQMQTRYKAKQDKHTSAVHREQMIFHKDKERKDERRRRQMARNFDAVLFKPPRNFGQTSNGERGFSHGFESHNQYQQSQTENHFYRRRNHSPAMEMNGALDSNWYNDDEGNSNNNNNNNNEHDNEDNEREEVSDSDDTTAKLVEDYCNFFGAANKRTNNVANNTQAKSTTGMAPQQQQQQSRYQQKQKTTSTTKFDGVAEWSSSSSDEQTTQSYAEGTKQKQLQKLPAKPKFVGIGGLAKSEQQQQQPQQSKSQQNMQQLLHERHVAAAVPPLISFTSSDEEKDDDCGKSSKSAVPPAKPHHGHKNSSLSVSALKKIIWSEDEDNAFEEDLSSTKNNKPPAMFAPPLSSTNVAVGTSTTAASTSSTFINNGVGGGTPNFDCPPVDSNPARWSTDKLCRWLTDARLAACAQRLFNEEVDGASLLLLTPTHYQNLGLKMGPTVKLQQMVEYLRQFTFADGCSAAGQNQ